MKKLIALAAACILLLGLFTGCLTVEPAPAETAAGETKPIETPPPKPTRTPPLSDDPTESEESASIVGTWKYTLIINDLLDYYVQQEDGTMDEAMAEVYGKLYEDTSMLMVIDLMEDDTFSISADKESVEALAATLSERLPALLPDLIAASSGMTREELEAKLAETGINMDTLVEQYSGQIGMMAQAMRPKAEKGTYTYEDGKLVFTTKDGDTATYTVVLDGDELTVTDIDSKSGTILGNLLPVVFVR